MRVKVCGLHPIRDVQLCIDLGVNFLGFVFYKNSPRNLNLEDIHKLKEYDKKGKEYMNPSRKPQTLKDG